MKSKLILIGILLISTIFSCSSQPLLKLNEDPAILKIFNEHEINSLIIILRFFDSHVLNKIPNESIDDAYHLYFESLRFSESYEDLNLKVGLDMPEKDSLFMLLKKNNIFHEIWKYEYGYNYETKDTLSINLAPNLDGKYWKWIEIISQRNTLLNEYKSKIEDCACLPSPIIIGLQNVHDKFDFNLETNRLIWAIHFITAYPIPE